MKKKIISLLVVAAMAISIVACGGAADNNKPSTPSGDSKPNTEATTPSGDNAGSGELDLSKAAGKKVGFTVPTLASDFINYLSQAVVGAFGDMDVTVQVDSCDGDVTKQIEQIENYVSMGMDAIIAFPVNGSALGVAVKNAVDAGVPVFGFAMEIPNVTSEMISAEETVMGGACGQMASDWIDKTFADAADGSINVIALRGSTQPELVVRSDAMCDAIAANSKVNLIKVESENQDDRAVAQKMIENQFNETQDISVIVACNAESALGANAFIMSPASPIKDITNFAIFGVDETTEIDENIKASIENKSAIRGIVSMGGIPDTIADMMKGMLPILCESEIVPRIDGSIFLIDASNVEEALNK